jgi:hypothetical protein
VRPTPQRLALLMSLAGLGLSLGELAQARSAPAAGAGRSTLGLEGPPSDGDGFSAARRGLDLPSIPAGPLDVTLSWQDPTEALSEEDRAAVALAMVLMAEPPSQASQAMPDFAASAPRWEFSPEFLRDFKDASSPGESFVSPPLPAPVAAASTARSEPGLTAERRVAPQHEAPTLQAGRQDLAPLTIAQVDLDLSAGAGAIAASAPVDVNVELSPALDLNLDLSPGLDLNLDLAPEVDLRLDRPPVFALTRLKPLGSVSQAHGAARPGTPAKACTADEPILAMDGAAPPPTSFVQAAVQAPSAEAAAAAASVLPALRATPAPAVESTPKVAATIVVASHADRVLRSLEVLLTSDDLAAKGFGARPEEVFVTSHTERALLMLASTCAGEAAAPPVADATPRISKVEPAPPAASCKPMVKVAPAARPARRSPIGADVVALAQGDLDKVRGGFETSAGLKISFGIERAVYINGALVTTTSLNVSDLGKVNGGAATVSTAVAGSSNLTLIQNGPGNTFLSGPVSAATVGTVVQNTLNDQKIQSITAINATVNSLQLVRAQNFQSTLRGTLIDSLRR